MSATSKVPVHSSSSYSTQPGTASALTTALVDAGSIPVIQATLLHELQASGWTANLRAYLTALMRSGECTKYDELMDRVLDEVTKDLGTRPRSAKASSAAADKDAGASGLQIPDAAIKQGVKVVKKELEKVCVVDDSK
ncbi:hypothetical protein MBLNU459_g1597t2 [Dothideomycetes sp. NU459]